MLYSSESLFDRIAKNSLKKRSLYWYQRFTCSADRELKITEEFTAFHGGHREVCYSISQLVSYPSQLRQKRSFIKFTIFDFF